MQEWYVRFVHYGHEFQGSDGKRYVAIAMPEKDVKTLPVVARENFRKWEILRAWRRNGVHRGTSAWDKEDQERAGYETVLPLEELEPVNEVRFIDPNYNEKFRVKTGTEVMFGSERRTAVYFDDYHLSLGTPGGYWNTYHIAELADIAKRNNITIKQIKEDS